MDIVSPEMDGGGRGGGQELRGENAAGAVLGEHSAEVSTQALWKERGRHGSEFVDGQGRGEEGQE